MQPSALTFTPCAKVMAEVVGMALARPTRSACVAPVRREIGGAAVPVAGNRRGRGGGPPCPGPQHTTGCP